MKIQLVLLFISCAAALVQKTALASEGFGVVAASGPRHVALIELFASEGCSSCSAEVRMAELQKAEGLWKEFVPVEFHVDYWDYLGWKDRFDSPAFTARQRSYARAWNASTVYTPAFVLDGREWTGGLPPDRGAGGADSGRLVIEQKAPHEFLVSFTPEAGFSGGTASLALLGFDLESDVRSGENAGRKLVHQFVVLELEKAALARDGSTGVWTATIKISEPHQSRLAVAGWVAESANGVPLQAAGGWLATRKP